MVRLSAAALLTLSLSVYTVAADNHVRNAPIPAGFNTSVGDPAGIKNIANNQGEQFIDKLTALSIGGACVSGADCASTCCAGLNGGAVCSGIGAQFQNGKQGCGFGGGGSKNDTGNASNDNASSGQKTNAAIPAGFNTAVGDASGAKNLANGQGKQFITGACISNADCASGCCAGLNGGAVCSGVGAQFQNGKQGCGFKAAKRSVDTPKMGMRFHA